MVLSKRRRRAGRRGLDFVLPPCFLVRSVSLIWAEEDPGAARGLRGGRAGAGGSEGTFAESGWSEAVERPFCA